MSKDDSAIEDVKDDATGVSIRVYTKLFAAPRKPKAKKKSFIRKADKERARKDAAASAAPKSFTNAGGVRMSHLLHDKVGTSKSAAMRAKCARQALSGLMFSPCGGVSEEKRIDDWHYVGTLDHDDIFNEKGEDAVLPVLVRFGNQIVDADGDEFTFRMCVMCELGRHDDDGAFKPISAPVLPEELMLGNKTRAGLLGRELADRFFILSCPFVVSVEEDIRRENLEKGWDVQSVRMDTFGTMCLVTISNAHRAIGLSKVTMKAFGGGGRHWKCEQCMKVYKEKGQGKNEDIIPTSPMRSSKRRPNAKPFYTRRHRKPSSSPKRDVNQIRISRTVVDEDTKILIDRWLAHEGLNEYGTLWCHSQQSTRERTIDTDVAELVKSAFERKRIY